MKTKENLPITRNEKGELLRWAPALYNSAFVADIPDKGRYSVTRLYKGSRKWILKFNGVPQPGLFQSANEAMCSLEPKNKEDYIQLT